MKINSKEIHLTINFCLWLLFSAMLTIGCIPGSSIKIQGLTYSASRIVFLSFCVLIMLFLFWDYLKRWEENS